MLRSRPALTRIALRRIRTAPIAAFHASMTVLQSKAAPRADPWNAMLNTPLREADPEIYKLVKDEERRQFCSLELIASEVKLGCMAKGGATAQRSDGSSFWWATELHVAGGHGGQRIRADQ